MDVTILSLFPEMFQGPLTTSLIGKAREKGLLNIEIVNFRDYATNKFHHVDDTPYGGGVGMLLQPQPIVDALRDKLPLDGSVPIILVSPQGKVFSQADANRLAQYEHIAFVCGHYEGFDERIRDYVTDEYSIGDYVLTGGELGALVIIDAVARLIPGVLGSGESPLDESFSSGLLEYPQYTRPREFEGREVPEVLLSGNHAQIQRWRREQALAITLARRPELLESMEFGKKERAYIESLAAVEEKFLEADGTNE